jgi:hypothetical protein
MKSGTIEWVPHQSTVNNKDCKRYFYVETKKIYFSGDFDSGNL